jgi:site-specific DNA-cytosine methylase
MYRQMGNSVAVPVITVLAKWIAEELIPNGK